MEEIIEEEIPDEIEEELEEEGMIRFFHAMMGNHNHLNHVFSGGE